MPYIKREFRNELDNSIYNLSCDIRNTDGTGVSREGLMNYAISKLIMEVYGPTWSYSSINEIIGVLECAKMEFYRKVAANYEDGKEEENGNVY